MKAAVQAWLAGVWQRILDVLIGVDDAAAALVFSDQTDLTISARCGMAQLDVLRGTVTLPAAEMSGLLELGAGLDRLQAHHCRGAILGDIARAQRVLAELQPYADYMAVNELPTQ